MNIPVCPRCGSYHVVPVIYGSLDICWSDLAAQGLVEIGSTLLHPSDQVLWRCKECEEDLPKEYGVLWRPSICWNIFNKSDPSVTYSEMRNKSPYWSVYKRIVASILKNYRASSEEELQRLHGANWLRVLSRSFGKNVTEFQLRRNEEGVHVSGLCNGNWKQCPDIPLNAYISILAYIDSITSSNTPKEYHVRFAIGRTHYIIFASLHVSDSSNTINLILNSLVTEDNNVSVQGKYPINKIKEDQDVV